jgi:adenylosuccinate lyase
MDVSASPLHTAAEQWLERTLDDSANKRLAISESFLAADAILRITLNVARGLMVYPATIAAHVAAELPFMATENILMAAVAAGPSRRAGASPSPRVAAGRSRRLAAATGDRQDLHERIRRHSQAAARQVKELGRPNDLLDRLRADPAFAKVDFRKVLDPRTFVGRAPRQVQEFLAHEVAPVLRRHRTLLGEKSELRV